jgi:ABC-type dipeptide/oligopeptide/nickel transport system permease subunit
MWVFPAAALVLTVLSANLIIDGVRDTLDPHGKRR